MTDETISAAQSDEEPGQRPAPEERVRQFPQTPGVYLMKNAAGQVIYIGKAKKLASAGRQLLSETSHRGISHSRLGR